MATEIRKNDSRAMEQVDALLSAEGLTRDANLDYTCGIFDENYNLIATGSAFGNTLRCFAVSDVRQGEGLLNEIVSHLISYEAERGHFRLFLYTKPGSARFFGDLGFYEVARTEKCVFMENRRGGFTDYLAALEKTRIPGAPAAVVMNANPFTLGHRYLVERAAAESDHAHLFVLSEEAGPIPFAVRRKLVREGVADLPNVICHDSGPYIISSATFPSYFLRDTDEAIRTHAELDLAVFGRIAGALGIACRYVGEEPASHVTSIYNAVMAERLPEHGVSCRVIPRLEHGGRAVSASTVRQAIHDGRLESVMDLLPDSTARYFTSPEAAPVIAAIRAMDDPKHY